MPQQQSLRGAVTSFYLMCTQQLQHQRCWGGSTHSQQSTQPYNSKLLQLVALHLTSSAVQQCSPAACRGGGGWGEGGGAPPNQVSLRSPTWSPHSVCQHTGDSSRLIVCMHGSAAELVVASLTRSSNFDSSSGHGISSSHFNSNPLPAASH